MSNKALLLTNAELELTQRMQMHFPRGTLPQDILEYWNSCPKETLAQAVTDVFNKKPENQILRPLWFSEKIMFDACDGTRTMVQHRQAFMGGICGKWDSYGLDNPGPATLPTHARIYELVKKARFKDMFLSLSPDLEVLCITQHQYIGFAEKYSFLFGPNNETFFLTKKDWGKPATPPDAPENFENVVVGVVDVHSGGLPADVYRFDHDVVWSAKFAYRLVVPRLTA